MDIERYEELVDYWFDGSAPMTNEEVEEVEEYLYDRILAHEVLTTKEISIFTELVSAWDSGIVEIGRKGWVSMYGIYKVRDRFFRLDYWYNDMCSDEYDEQVLQEVVEKEVVRKEWRFVNDELNNV